MAKKDIYKQKSVTITQDQETFVNDSCISLSKFLQKKIDELRLKK